MQSHAIDGDGINPEVFKMLGRISKTSVTSATLPFRIPDTILYYGCASFWYYYDPGTGSVQKHPAKMLEKQTIYNVFTTPKPTDRTDIVAVFASTRARGLNCTYLTKADLHAFLFPEKRTEHFGLLQRFIEPRSAHCDMYQLIFSPSLQLLLRRTNRAKIYDRTIEPTLRCCCFDGPSYQSEEMFCLPHITAKYAKLASDFASFFSGVEPRHEISRMALVFRRDFEGVYWLLFSTSIRVVDTTAPVATNAPNAAGSANDPMLTPEYVSEVFSRHRQLVGLKYQSGVSATLQSSLAHSANTNLSHSAAKHHQPSSTSDALHTTTPPGPSTENTSSGPTAHLGEAPNYHPSSATIPQLVVDKTNTTPETALVLNSNKSGSPTPIRKNVKGAEGGGGATPSPAQLPPNVNPNTNSLQLYHQQQKLFQYQNPQIVQSAAHPRAFCPITIACNELDLERVTRVPIVNTTYLKKLREKEIPKKRFRPVPARLLSAFYTPGSDSFSENDLLTYSEGKQKKISSMDDKKKAVQAENEALKAEFDELVKFAASLCHTDLIDVVPPSERLLSMQRSERNESANDGKNSQSDESEDDEDGKYGGSRGSSGRQSPSSGATLSDQLDPSALERLAALTGGNSALGMMRQRSVVQGSGGGDQPTESKFPTFSPSSKLPSLRRANNGPALDGNEGESRTMGRSLSRSGSLASGLTGGVGGMMALRAASTFRMRRRQSRVGRVLTIDNYSPSENLLFAAKLFPRSAAQWKDEFDVLGMKYAFQLSDLFYPLGEVVNEFRRVLVRNHSSLGRMLDPLAPQVYYIPELERNFDFKVAKNIVIPNPTAPATTTKAGVPVVQPTTMAAQDTDSLSLADFVRFYSAAQQGALVKGNTVPSFGGSAMTFVMPRPMYCFAKEQLGPLWSDLHIEELPWDLEADLLNWIEKEESEERRLVEEQKELERCAQAAAAQQRAQKAHSSGSPHSKGPPLHVVSSPTTSAGQGPSTQSIIQSSSPVGTTTTSSAVSTPLTATDAPFVQPTSSLPPPSGCVPLESSALNPTGDSEKDGASSLLDFNETQIPRQEGSDEGCVGTSLLPGIQQQAVIGTEGKNSNKSNKFNADVETQRRRQFVRLILLPPFAPGSAFKIAAGKLQETLASNGESLVHVRAPQAATHVVSLAYYKFVEDLEDRHSTVEHERTLKKKNAVGAAASQKHALNKSLTPTESGEDTPNPRTAPVFEVGNRRQVLSALRKQGSRKTSTEEGGKNNESASAGPREMTSDEQKGVVRPMNATNFSEKLTTTATTQNIESCSAFGAKEMSLTVKTPFNTTKEGDDQKDSDQQQQQTDPDDAWKDPFCTTTVGLEENRVFSEQQDNPQHDPFADETTRTTEDIADNRPSSQIEPPPQDSKTVPEEDPFMFNQSKGGRGTIAPKEEMPPWLTDE